MKILVILFLLISMPVLSQTDVPVVHPPTDSGPKPGLLKLKPEEIKKFRYNQFKLTLQDLFQVIQEVTPRCSKSSINITNTDMVKAAHIINLFVSNEKKAETSQSSTCEDCEKIKNQTYSECLKSEPSLKVAKEMFMHVDFQRYLKKEFKLTSDEATSIQLIYLDLFKESAP